MPSSFSSPTTWVKSSKRSNPRKILPKKSIFFPSPGEDAISGWSADRIETHLSSMGPRGDEIPWQLVVDGCWVLSKLSYWLILKRWKFVRFKRFCPSFGWSSDWNGLMKTRMGWLQESFYCRLIGWLVSYLKKGCFRYRWSFMYGVLLAQEVPQKQTL